MDLFHLLTSLDLAALAQAQHEFSAGVWQYVASPVDPGRGLAVFATAGGLVVAIGQLLGGRQTRRRNRTAA